MAQRAAAAGHRVVLVVATDGALGQADESTFGTKGDALAATRRRELAASARALGVARTVELGHADSGSGPEVWPDPPGGRRFVRVPVDDAATALADVLVEERADVVFLGRAGLREPAWPQRAAAELGLALQQAGYDGTSRIIAADHMLAGMLRTRFPRAPAACRRTVPVM